MSAITSLVPECSTSSSLESDTSSTSSIRSEPEIPQERSMRRKREAASRIPRIPLDANGSRSGSASANSSRGSSRDSVRSRTDRQLEDVDEESEEAKRQRLSSYEFDAVNDLGDAARCSGSTSDRECSPQADHCSPDLNGKVLYGYKFFGSGKDFYATHVETQVHKQCQIINKEQYKQIVKVKQRLNDADDLWRFDDVEEMSNFVLPSEAEVYECGQGKYIVLSPWQHGNLDINEISGKAKKDGIENVLRPLFKQIVKGVAFCHALGIMVRDLKPKKFVFVDKEKTTLRLHDVFGLYVCENVDDDVMVDHRGVPAYVAPEVLRNVPVEYAGKPADIWALGVLLYYILFQTHPFIDRDIDRVFNRIRRVSFCIPPTAITSQAVRILIYGIFKKEPADRPTAEQLLRLRWFSDQTNSVCTSYPSVWPCMSMNVFAGFAGNRQSLLAPGAQAASGRPLLSPTYRHRRTRRPQDDAQVVPNGLHSSNVHSESSNILTVNAAAAARYIERIALSLRNRRTGLNLGSSGPAL